MKLVKNVGPNLLCFMTIICCYCTLGNKHFGKYKVFLKELNLCKGKYPKELVQSFNFTHEIVVRDGFSFSHGTIQIKGDTKKYRISYTCYSLINGKMVKRFEMTNVSCHDFFGSILLTFTRVPYDMKTCVMKKGSYPFDVDVDAIHHTFLPEWEYGTLMLKFEITSGKKSVICTQAVLSTVPETL